MYTLKFQYVYISKRIEKIKNMYTFKTIKVARIKTLAIIYL